MLASAAMGLAACDRGAPPPAEPTGGAMEMALPIPVMGRERTILAFGDSFLSGPGLNEGEHYPARLETALRAHGVNARIMNASITNETSGEGLARLSGVLEAQHTAPELVIISLGANDMLQGRSPAETRANLDEILSVLVGRGIRVLLLGAMAAPDLRADYARDFNPIYPNLAHKYGVSLVPYFLQPLVGKPDLVQPGRVFPTALGVEEMVAATVDDVAEALPPDASRTVGP